MDDARGPGSDRPVPVATPVLSSTVVVLRPAESGPEILLIRRPPGGYVPGDWAFPGGRVDPADHAAPAGPLASCDCSRALGLDDATTARACCLAAARELCEETGLLLARDRSGRSVDPATAEAVAAASGGRAEAWYAALASRGLVAAADLLAPFAHWITPEGLPRRFDTWFFAARAPAGQRARPCNETAGLRWMRPADAVAENATGGEVSLPPPTLDALVRLAAVFDAPGDAGPAGLDALLAAWSRNGPPRAQRPAMVDAGPDGPAVVLAGDPLHPDTASARPTARYRFVLRDGRFRRVRND